VRGRRLCEVFPNVQRFRGDSSPFLSLHAFLSLFLSLSRDPLPIIITTASPATPTLLISIPHRSSLIPIRRGLSLNSFVFPFSLLESRDLDSVYGIWRTSRCRPTPQCPRAVGIPFTARPPTLNPIHAPLPHRPICRQNPDQPTSQSKNAGRTIITVKINTG
jgi:hypothetical protein